MSLNHEDFDSVYEGEAVKSGVGLCPMVLLQLSANATGMVLCNVRCVLFLLYQAI